MGNSIEETKAKVLAIRSLKSAKKSVRAYSINKTVRGAIDGALIALACCSVDNAVLKILLIIALGLRAGWNVIVALLCALGVYSCKKSVDALEEDIIEIK